MIVKVLDNQSLFDIALMHCGKAELAYDIAIANGISVTDSVSVGSEITIPDGLKVNNDIVQFYKQNGVKPATYTD